MVCIHFACGDGVSVAGSFRNKEAVVAMRLLCYKLCPRRVSGGVTQLLQTGIYLR